MANAPSVNVPPADLIMSFIERALKSPYADQAILVVLKPKLQAAVTRIEERLGGAQKNPEHDRAKGTTRARDGDFDDANRFAVLLLEALVKHPEEAVRDAAAHLLALLFPERLAVIQLAFELEAASGATFAKRLEQTRAKAAIATLAGVFPAVATHLAAIVSTAKALGEALEALDAFMVDKAGRPLDPELFAARTDAHRLFARYIEVVDTFAYPDDSPEHNQARAALAGPYRRFLSANLRGEAGAEPSSTPGPTPTPEATT